MAKIEGLDEIVRKLKSLPQKIGNNATRRSLRKGANVILKAGRNNAQRIDDPETREQIYKNLAVASGGRKRERQAGGVIMRVGVRGGARFNPEGDALPGGNTTGYWRFVHFGVPSLNIPARPFLSKAGAEQAGAAVAAVVADLNKQIDKEIARL